MSKLSVIASSQFQDCQCDFYENEDRDVFMSINQLAKALGYKDRNGIEQVLSRNKYLKEAEFSVTDKLSATDGKAYNTRLFTEDGIYEVSMLSNTKKALQFRRWVRNVLKSIRKTGTYTTPNAKQQIEQKEYTYIDKYYKGQLVITFLDLEHFTGISKYVLHYHFNHSKNIFAEGIDYWHLTGTLLAEFKKQNRGFNKRVGNVTILTKTGFDKLARLVEGISGVLECFKEEKNCYEPIDPNIKQDSGIRTLIKSAKENLTTLNVLLNAFDSYNHEEAYKTYQKAMIEVERTLGQCILAIGHLDVHDSSVKLLPFRKQEPEWQKEHRRAFGIDGSDKYTEGELLIASHLHKESNTKMIFMLE